MPDPAAALAETRRVLRPGGRLALAVWRSAEQNPWISIVGRILVERGLFPRPEPGAPGMFVLASEERLRAVLEDAGFAVERMEDVPVLFVYRDVEDYVVRAKETGGGFAKGLARGARGRAGGDHGPDRGGVRGPRDRREATSSRAWLSPSLRSSESKRQRP